MNTAMIPFAQGVGFAIPVNTMKWVVQQILEKGRVIRPWLGISGANMNQAIARRYDLRADSGVLVVEVDSRGPAYEAGMRVGDVIVQVGAHPVKQMKDILMALSKLAIYEEVEVGFIRLNAKRKALLRLKESPIAVSASREGQNSSMALIDLSQIVNLVYFASFFMIFFYGQRLQVQWQLVSVKRSLGKLERSKTAARQKFVDSISRFQMDKKTVETKIDRLNNSFTITPVSLDPSGIVGKLEHVLDTYDDHLKMEVKAIAPNATESDVNTLSNQLEISIGLDGMFRLVRHFYLLAKKTGGIMALAQLQMALTMVIE